MREGPEEESVVRIIIVDDHEIVREGLLATLAASPDLHVVGAAATGRTAVELARRVTPEVALVDLRLPDMSGNDVCRELLRVVPSMAVIMLSTYLSEEAVRSALSAGAAGYVTKAAGVSKLREVLHGLRGDAAARPQIHHAPQIVKQLHELVAEREGGIRATPQQERVLELAAQGLTNRQVGERLFISESTVRFHIQKLKETTCARTRTELIAKAIRAGMIAPAAEDLRAVR
jgi:DNA-binding NarL/FixJ family response regulator